MSTERAALKTSVFFGDDVVQNLRLGVATVCLIWYLIVVLVCTIGYTQIRRFFSSRPKSDKWSEDEAPRVTVIRPVKGLEPRLYECLASTLRQDYPKDKLQIRLCVSDRHDPSIPVLERVAKDFSSFDVAILIEEDDPKLNDGSLQLGPNPKVRNMSRAYREATGDLIWIIDCNVWVGTGVCSRMVSKLTGRHGQRKYKFVHLLPISVDIAGEDADVACYGKQLNGSTKQASSSGKPMPSQHTDSIISTGGGRLEELFLASSHSKFYTAINTVLIAPCIVGKSTMFRRSHVDALTKQQGIDYFSENICEDHLIGDLLWKKALPGETRADGWGKHAMLFGDLAVQPTANLSLLDFWKRRARWLRVRKFTVILATLVEPGTESFLCSLYGAYAVTTLPWFTQLGIPSSWSMFFTFWLLSVSIWCVFDRTLYLLLHSGRAIETDENTPSFARPPKDGVRRPFLSWLAAWLGREGLTFPIWFWAFWGGTKVEWRGKWFRVGMDMKVHELEPRSSSRKTA